jgi:signal peptidase I
MYGDPPDRSADRGGPITPTYRSAGSIYGAPRGRAVADDETRELYRANGTDLGRANGNGLYGTGFVQPNGTGQHGAERYGPERYGPERYGAAIERPNGTAPRRQQDRDVGPHRRMRKQMPLWQEMPLLLIVAFCLAVLIRTFLLQAFFIPSGSMEDTLLVGDRVLVNKVIYDMRDPKRGEIVVFEPPVNWGAGPGKDDYIKRVIGVAGDHVICCDAQDRLTVNGHALDENYLFPGNKPSDVPFDVTVPQGRVFVMGDHRSASADSRVHLEADSGTVPLSRVVGRAFVIFWPVSRAGTLPVPKSFAAVPDPKKS